MEASSLMSLQIRIAIERKPVRNTSLSENKGPQSANILPMIVKASATLLALKNIHPKAARRKQRGTRSRVSLRLGLPSSLVLILLRQMSTPW